MKLLFKYPDETVDKNDETFKYYQQQALKVAECGVDELESFKVYEDELLFSFLINSLIE